MIYVCRCGNRKTDQPYKASGLGNWLCSKCQKDLPKPQEKSNKLKQLREKLVGGKNARRPAD